MDVDDMSQYTCTAVQRVASSGSVNSAKRRHRCTLYEEAEQAI